MSIREPPYAPSRDPVGTMRSYINREWDALLKAGDAGPLQDYARALSKLDVNDIVKLLLLQSLGRTATTNWPML